MLIALAQLLGPLRPLTITHEQIDNIPVTVYRPRAGDPASAPAIVIAHGFAGSRQLMAPFAATFARAGYTAFLFDFPGHGRNVTPFQNGSNDPGARRRQLGATLDVVVQAARSRSDGRVGLLGHSMGSEVVTRYAQEHLEIAATVAVSLVYGGVTPTSPRNLLVLTGALEGGLQASAQGIADAAAGGTGQTGVTYGDISAGSARRVVYPALVEHIGVLFSPISMNESLRWFDAAFARATSPAPYLDMRWIWLGLLFLCAVTLFWALAQTINIALPVRPESRLLAQPVGARGMWWLAALIPVVLAPVLLRLLPAGNVLPILVGGPLALFFLLYGGFTAVGLLLLERAKVRTERELAGRTPGLIWSVGLALATFAYVLLTFGLPSQLFLLNYFFPAARGWVFVAVFAAMLPYFLTDERLTRWAGAPRGAYPITKVLFMLALAAAIIIDSRLFFLVLVAPVFALYFVIYGLFSGWLHRATGLLLPGALANAAIFAWFVAAVFPFVG